MSGTLFTGNLNAMIMVSGEKESLGKIININMAFCTLFGYKQ